MASKILTSIFPEARADFANPMDTLEKAIARYGEIKTFFSKYTNPVGIELEIENVPTSFRSLVKDHSIYWRYCEDGSLKVAGAEFVSVPLSGKNIDYAINEFNKLSVGQNFLYSVRTSTHVHLNVSFLTGDQFIKLILVAALFEPLMHQLCEPTRKHNPYCYPITQLNIYDVLKFNGDLKYCGINPAPVRSQMTLEFRQLHGTDDWRQLRRWIQLICKMHYYIKSTPSKEVRADLETMNLEALAKKVFGASMILFSSVSSACKDSSEWVIASMPTAFSWNFGE